MRIKILSLSLVLYMLTLFASCNPSKEINSKTTKKESTTQTTKSKEEKEFDIKNYNKFFTSEDKQYVYCIDSYGLYKISKSDNTTKKLVTFDNKIINYGYCLTLHNDYIYFTKCNKLFRIQKDGSNYYKFNNINQKITFIKCIRNILYVNGYDFECCYDIKNDPKDPEAIRNYTNPPTLNNKIYFRHQTDALHISLYSSEIDGTNEKIILNNVDKYFIYNDRIFYYPGRHTDLLKIYMCDINGKHSKPIYKTKNQEIEFLDFDSNWLYIYEHGNSDYKRINCVTKEIQDLNNINSPQSNRINYFEINNGYIFSRELGHAKYIKCDGSGEWQDIKF